MEDFAYVSVTPGYKSDSFRIFMPDHLWAYVGCDFSGLRRSCVSVQGKYDTGIVIAPFHPGRTLGRSAKVGSANYGNLLGVNVSKNSRSIPETLKLYRHKVAVTRMSSGLRLKPMLRPMLSSEVEVPISRPPSVGAQNHTHNDVIAAVRLLNEIMDGCPTSAILTVSENRVAASITFR